MLDERVSLHYNKLLLERSRGLPLNVVLHSVADRYHCSKCRAHTNGSGNYTDAIGMLPDILPKIRKLSIFIEREDHGEIWEALQNLDHATKLESLHFGGVGGASYFHRGDATVEIPDRLSAQNPPSLASLELWGVKIVWENSLYCSSLRRLKISHYLSNPHVHLGHLLDALRNMPRLEILIMDNVPSPRVDKDYRPVTLSTLRDLQLPLNHEPSASLLSSLRIPSFTSVSFVAYPPRRTLRKKKPIPDTVQQAMVQAMIALLRGNTVHAMSYVENEGPRYSLSVPYLRMWTAQEADVPVSESLPWAHILPTLPRIVVNASLDDPLIMRLLSAVDLRSVHTIAIADETARKSRSLVESFRGAENLACLRLRGEVAFPVGAVLSGWSRPAHLDAEQRREIENLRRKALAKEVDWTTECDWETLPPSWYGFGEVNETDPHPRTDWPNAHVPREGSPTPCGGPYPLFPHLQTLVVEAVDFPLAKRRGHTDSDYRFCQGLFHFHDNFHGIEYGFPVKGLARSLQLRADTGVSEVVRVEFKDCQCLEKERLAPLVEIVPTVVWDGRCLTLEDVRTTSKQGRHGSY